MEKKIEKPKYDLIVILIANTYEGTKLGGTMKELKVVLEDIENFKRLCIKYGLKCWVLKNKTKDELFKHLSNAQSFIEKTEVTQVLLMYSGHGYENERNLISGIYTNDFDLKKVNLTDITNYFKSVEKLYIFFGGCRVQRESPINYEQIQNNFVILVSAVPYACPAYGKLGIGNEFVYSFLKTFDEFLAEHRSDYIGVGIFLSIFYHTFRYYTTEYKEIPNIYANKNVRIRGKDDYDQILKLTTQPLEEAKVTKINVQAKKNILVQDLKNRKKMLIESMKSLIDIRDKILELKKLGKPISDLITDEQILKNKIEKQETEIRFIEKKLKELE